jgi:hypothetical protein
MKYNSKTLNFITQDVFPFFQLIISSTFIHYFTIINLILYSLIIVDKFLKLFITIHFLRPKLLNCNFINLKYFIYIN